MKKVKILNIRQTLVAMNVGEEVVFGYREAPTSSVRSAACTLNKTDRRYKVVQRNQELKTVVTRLA